MSKYQAFNFDKYEFDRSSGVLNLQYSYDDSLAFTETLTFDFDFVDYDDSVLQVALQNVFLLAGISYYKAFLPPKIDVNTGLVTPKLAAFLNKTYQRGLGEFFYVNKFDPKQPIGFTSNTAAENSLVQNTGKGALIGIGGGKDSLVTIEALLGSGNITSWSVGHKDKLDPLIKATGLPHINVERVWDRQLLELNATGAYNGHVPISALLAAIGVVVAILSGHQDVVVSNEHSANEPTLLYDGVEVNHQYSKSEEFEEDFQNLLLSQFGTSIRYFSFLRPLSELRIAELFCRSGLEKYKTTFSSCNKAYTLGGTMGWCGKCAKCAFVYLILANFADQAGLDTIFDGHNLLLDPALEDMYRNLLGTAGEKPLECVGEIQESRVALQNLKIRYPGLNKFEFELDNSYDSRKLYSHRMPESYFDILTSRLNAL